VDEVYQYAKWVSIEETEGLAVTRNVEASEMDPTDAMGALSSTTRSFLATLGIITTEQFLSKGTGKTAKVFGARSSMISKRFRFTLMRRLRAITMNFAITTALTWGRAGSGARGCTGRGTLLFAPDLSAFTLAVLKFYAWFLPLFRLLFGLGHHDSLLVEVWLEPNGMVDFTHCSFFSRKPPRPGNFPGSVNENETSNLNVRSGTILLVTALTQPFFYYDFRQDLLL
jgi:hypothetical protein